jgi:hypothetical protein
MICALDEGSEEGGAMSWQPETDQRTAFEKRMRSMRRWRMAIAVGGLVLGVVLVATGNVLIGVIVGGLAVARLVMFSRFPVGGGRGRGGRASGNPSDRQWLRAQARDEFLVAARVIGCSPQELQNAFQQGKSVAEFAAERSVPVENVTTAVAADLDLKARNAAATGTMSETDAQRMHERAPQFAQRMVYGHRGDFGRARRTM